MQYRGEGAPKPKGLYRSILVLDDAHDLAPTGVAVHTHNVLALLQNNDIIRVVISNIKVARATEYVHLRRLEAHVLGSNGRFDLQVVDAEGHERDVVVCKRAKMLGSGMKLVIFVS